MCGICGFVGMHDPDLLRRMAERMRHRGPDDEGLYEEPGAGLACRRLSIIDVAGGHQPIANETRTITVVQNGEIYNYKELRDRLIRLGHRFATRSDTEVIVHAYEEWGETFARELNGDFAIALWDAPRRRLLLTRDRLGVHPLYYARVGPALLFASEIKSLLCAPSVPRALDAQAIDDYLTWRYVPEGRTLFAGIRKVSPGTILLASGGQIEERWYWTLPAFGEDRVEDPRELADSLWALLQDAVRLRLRSDVPVGAYLSGGLDSGTVVALMSRLAPQPVQTFCIGFGTARDEFDAARAQARASATRHEELVVAPDDFARLPRIVWHLDEPIGDAIVIPTFRLAEAAARQVKVVLSGEGADEVFGGYIHHVAVQMGAGLRRLAPAPAIRLAGRLAARLPLPLAARVVPYPAAPGAQGRQVLARYLQDLSGASLPHEYRALAAVFPTAERDALYTPDFREALDGTRLRWPDGAVAETTHRLNGVMRLDLLHWLPDYTLLKQDKLGLAHGLEVRVPYLDHRIVELATRLPADLRVRGLTTKRLLRLAGAGRLPRATVAAPKQAFFLPVEKVFGVAFDEYVRDVLGSRRCQERGILRPEALRDRLRHVRTGELLVDKQLVVLLMLELWMQVFIDADGAPPGGAP